jgi:hypothetical protein
MSPVNIERAENQNNEIVCDVCVCLIKTVDPTRI